MQGKKDNRFNDDILCAEYEAVYHYTLALCRDEALAQDITQETFLKAMKAIFVPTIPPKQSNGISRAKS